MESACLVTQDQQLIANKLSLLVNKKQFGDIVLLVGEEEKEFFALGPILAAQSTVFHTMLYGGEWIEQSQKQVKIPDGDPETFEDFLQYIYTGSISINEQNALNMIHLGKKYGFESLEDAAYRYITDFVNVQNVLTVLSAALLYSETTLRDKCLQLIDQQTVAVLSSPSLLSTSRDVLLTILRRDTLDISEVTLFQHFVKWAEAQEGQTLQEALLPFIPYFRFPTILPRDLISVVKPLGVLPPEEYIEALEYQFAPELFFDRSDESRFRPRRSNDTENIYFSHQLSDLGEDLTVSPDGLTLFKSTAMYHSMALCNVSYSIGVHYWEVKIDKFYSGVSIGVVDRSQLTSLLAFVGQHPFSWGYLGNGNKTNGNKPKKYGPKYTKGDTVGVLLNMEEKTLSFFWNRKPCGGAFHLTGERFTPAVSLFQNSQVTFITNVTIPLLEDR